MSSPQQPVSAGKPEPSPSLVRRLLKTREAGIFLSIIAVSLAIMALGPDTRSAFLGAYNLQSLSRQIAMLGIFAIGEALVIIAAGIDLSVGSLIAFSGVVAALMFARHGWGIIPTMMLVMLLGTAIGVVHAAFIAKLNMPPFVITLGSLEILRGAALLLTESMPVPIKDETYGAFNFLGNGMVAQIPVPVFFLVGVTLLGLFLMHYTVWGRYIYGLGGNEQAARLSGVNVDRIKVLVYGASGLLAALAGLLYAAYNREGNPSSGIAYELNAIAAAVIGGCSLMGGEGSVLGTVFGATLLAVILNGINLAIKKNASLWEGVIVGAVVVGAVAMNLLRERKSRTR